MRQKIFIFTALFFLILILVGLNAASYVQKEKVPDNELEPNRSTYNFGATGTRAFYDLLAETGHDVMRWQEKPAKLLEYEQNNPTTFIIIGDVRREITEKDAEDLLRWVSDGNTLILIDRQPAKSLTTTTTNWEISFQEPGNFPVFNTDPSDQKQMTNETDAAQPAQPTIFAESVNGVQISRFASYIKLNRFTGQENTGKQNSPKIGVVSSDYEPPPAPIVENEPNENFNKNSSNDNGEISAVRTEKAAASEDEETESEVLNAPFVHLADGNRNILVDAPFGSGKIVFLTDPYIVANGGINLADNAQLAVNIAASDGGIIAFDEYHQGYGANDNLILDYFAGTPVAAIFLQIALLVGLIFFAQSRRFARALPDEEPNRLSKLEYVSAMAELQQRTKAYDLAIENIYKDFHRRAARLVGADNFTISRENLAKQIAERTKFDFAEIDELMFKCEDIIHGEPTNKNEIVKLTSRLRELEKELGLQRSKVKSKK